MIPEGHKAVCQECRAGKGIWAEGQQMQRLRDRNHVCVDWRVGGCTEKGGLLPRDHVVRTQAGGRGT